MKATMPLLRISDMSLTIGATKILQDINLQLQHGEILAITGESGSGKSMAALSIMGLLPRGALTTGQIMLDGTEILTTSETNLCKLRGDTMSMVFQEIGRAHV